MGTGAWGHEHGAWGPERGDGIVRQFFLVVFCQKLFDGDRIMGQFFWFFCQNFFTEKYFCLWSTWGQEQRDGTVWLFISGCLFAITPNLLPLPKKILSHDFSSQQHQPLPLPIGHLLSKKIPVAVSANFLHVTMEACRQEHGNGSMGAWSMGT